MKMTRFLGWLVAALLVCPPCLQAQSGDTNAAMRAFSGALLRLTQIIQPTNASQAFVAGLKIGKAGGLPSEMRGSEFQLAYHAPDRLRLSAKWEGRDMVVGRDKQEVWVRVPSKKFALTGAAGRPLFASAPDRKDATVLGPIKLPVPPEQILVLPFLMQLQPLPDETVAGTKCKVVKGTPTPEAQAGFKLPAATLQIWARESDSMPLRIAYRDGKSTDVEVELIEPQFKNGLPEDTWRLESGPGDHVESVALGHLTRFLSVALRMLTETVPTLGPSQGDRRVAAREGNGRLEIIDGTKVLFLKGTPEEMGKQHGALMRREVKDLVDHILYGVGVGSSFEKGRWFFGEIESAQARLAPFMDPRYLREMDALAQASGLPAEEVRLANFFPELFHCSGFALFGKATVDGSLYHGRILDYLRGMGLEQNAVVMIVQPDEGNAWVNVGYAGFTGSVTAMNEKRVAIGEMGGRGEGNWDGKPMAQLMREVMEKADTLEEAVEIMRKGPRTCEYYYVISDAKTKRAVGIAATPDRFEVVRPGQAHPQLPHAIADAVLMSAGDRYEELARRVQSQHGKIDAEKARDLMKRPVCMTSNIHSALFAPDTLDFWVANADSRNPAAHTRYTRYNLAELLKPEPAQQ